VNGQKVTSALPSRGPAPHAPPLAWTALADAWEPDSQSMSGELQPICGGFKINVVAPLVCNAARMDESRSTYDWRPLANWLRAGIGSDVILRAIRLVASRASYKPPNTLAYFNNAVMEAAGLPVQERRPPRMERPRNEHDEDLV